MNRILYSRRQVALWGGLLLLVLLPLFISLGMWQWNKAEAKFARQADLEALSRGAPAAMPRQPASAESLRYRHFALLGEYDAARQILIDNRVQGGQAGYEVVTPLKLAGSDLHVLVNRGWIPAPADHSQVPAAPPPAGTVAITGIAVVPPVRFFTLAPDGAGESQSNWQPVWQNLDLERFRRLDPYPTQPVVLQLDPDAPGGYGRQWVQPEEGADRNLGYAVQWFGFAIASLGIWLYFLVRRP
ncbi:MAG TPA: SURF1 family protein [Rhodocyclaceae bacterium]|nr:SURF1 family protein [Rhodocyclaceae bacterium]